MYNSSRFITMKKRTIIATLAVALIAGVSIFAACTKEENKESKHVQELVSSVHNKNLSEDELNELMQYFDSKVTTFDGESYVTTFFYTNADFCVKKYLNSDNTSFAGVCFFDEEAQHSFLRIDDNKLELTYDEFVDSVFLTNILFNEDEFKVSFNIKVGETEYSGTTIEMSETVFAGFMGFVNGTNTLTNPDPGGSIWGAIKEFFKSTISNIIESNAEQCFRSFDDLAKACINNGGSPTVNHRLLHLWCTFECNMPNPNPDN